MATYKLIKKYPGSPELGTIASKGMGVTFKHPDGRVTGNVSSAIDEFKELIETQPEFWELVLDYEILILEHSLSGSSSGALFTWNKDSQKWLTKNGSYLGDDPKFHNPYSVKRIQDDVVFTVGDLVLTKMHKTSTHLPPFKIVSFTRTNDSIKAFVSANEHRSSVLLKNIELAPKPIVMATPKGESLCVGDLYTSVHKESMTIDSVDKKVEQKDYRLDLFHFFKTKQDAIIYIQDNAKVLSVRDVLNIINTFSVSRSTYEPRLRNLAKTKVKENIKAAVQ